MSNQVLVVNDVGLEIGQRPRKGAGSGSDQPTFRQNIFTVSVLFRGEEFHGFTEKSHTGVKIRAVRLCRRFRQNEFTTSSLFWAPRPKVNECSAADVSPSLLLLCLFFPPPRKALNYMRTRSVGEDRRNMGGASAPIHCVGLCSLRQRINPVGALPVRVSGGDWRWSGTRPGWESPLQLSLTSE